MAMTESSLTILHRTWDVEDDTPHILDFQKGYPGHVEFDFTKIWKGLKKFRKEAAIGLHFIHVHPQGYGIQMSDTDVNCLEGFMCGFGISPLFSIIEFTDDKLGYKQSTYEIGPDYAGDKEFAIMTLTDSAKPEIPIWGVDILWNLATQKYFPLNYKPKEITDGT